MEDEELNAIIDEAETGVSGESSVSPRPALEQGHPMSRADYLLSHLAQECCEVAIRCTKAQMFGLDEIQPGQQFTNRQRILHELCDLLAIGEVLRDEEVLPDFAMNIGEVHERVEAKKVKAAGFSDYSRSLGRLEATSSALSEQQNDQG